MSEDNTYEILLAKYLLDYKDGALPPDNDDSSYKINPKLFSKDQLIDEINKLDKKLKPFLRPTLTNFSSFSQHEVSHSLEDERQKKHELLEHHNVCDKLILLDLKQFCIVAIALLVKLERMHKKHVLCGNVNPYTFIYFKKQYKCEPYDLAVLLSDKNVVNSETKEFGDYIFVVTDLNSVFYNKYLAPELKHSVEVYRLQYRLKKLLYEAEIRDLKLDNQEEIEHLLYDFHQKRIKYTNRAEIYSVGYTLNQILSHTISKLAHFGLSMSEFVTDEIPAEIIKEADLLLPDTFANPEDERIIKLLNEAITYIHDLMHTHLELRDTLEVSIEKFTSLLKRITTTTPHDTLEGEEAEDDESEGESQEAEAEESGELEAEEAEEEEEEEREEEDAEREEREEEELEEEDAEREEDAEELEEAEAHEEHEHASHEAHIHEHTDHEHASHEAHDHSHAGHEHEEHEEHEEEEEHDAHEGHESHEGHDNHDASHDNEHSTHDTPHSADHDDAHATGSHDSHDDAQHEDPKAHPNTKANKLVPRRPSAH